MSDSNQSTVLPATAPSGNPNFDFLVMGSGFAGSLIATILQTQGRRVAIVDRSSHPRFAVGESSTPAANLILSSLAKQYGLEWLKPFAKYGTWKKSYPNITIGRKRGFSYFQHEAGKPFQPQADHSNELLAAASSSDEFSDTQWLRSDVDAFFFRKACESGVAAFENCEVSKLARCDSGWSIELARRSNSPLNTPTSPVRGVPLAQEIFNASHALPHPVSAAFLIDASGSGQVLAKHLDISSDTQQLVTNSRAIFTHAAGLPEWRSILEHTAPGSTSDHPFHCDHAAEHHILEEGWMWWLRFDSDVTSVGLVLDARSDDKNLTTGNLDSSTEFHEIISRYPSLKAAFETATLADLTSMPIRTARLQRLASQIVGEDWAMLPHTAGFIDPLHSTGIAHSLAGVERLASILLTGNSANRNTSPGSMLQLYGSVIREELTLIDQLVAGCYDAIAEGSFSKFTTFTMCYFAAATTWERQRLNHETALTSNSSPNLVTRSVSEGQDSAHSETSNPSLTHRVTSSARLQHPALLCADVADFRAAVINLRERMPNETDDSYENLCKETLAPYNHVGLFEPLIPNMYGGTAMPEGSKHRTSNIELPTSK